MFLNKAWSSINKQTNKKRLDVLKWVMILAYKGLLSSQKMNPLISNLGVTKNILSFDCSLIVAKH